MSSLHSDHLLSIWNLYKTEKNLQLSFETKSSFWPSILNDLMNEIIACEQAPEGASAGQQEPARILPDHQCLRPKFGRKAVIGGL